jgi:hypothetical protein
MSNYRKQLRKLVKRRGWTMSVANSGHIVLSKPGCQSIRCSWSPRSETALRNVERDLDRAEGKRRTGWAAE